MADIQVVEDNTELFIREMASAIDRGLERIGIKAEGDCVGYMTTNHIYDTGWLRNSITHRVDSGSDSVLVGTNVEYGPYVHMGHMTRSGKHVDGRPFLTAPIQANMPSYEELMKKEMTT